MKILFILLALKISYAQNLCHQYSNLGCDNCVIKNAGNDDNLCTWCGDFSNQAGLNGTCYDNVFLNNICKSTGDKNILACCNNQRVGTNSKYSCADDIDSEWRWVNIHALIFAVSIAFFFNTIAYVNYSMEIGEKDFSTSLMKAIFFPVISWWNNYNKN